MILNEQIKFVAEMRGRSWPIKTFVAEKNLINKYNHKNEQSI